MNYFQLPLNLPHAGKISMRIEYHLQRVIKMTGPEHAAALKYANDLMKILVPFHESGENPPIEEAKQLAAESARLGRAIVNEIELLGVGDDRLGQSIRNLFECLALGEEGMRISLRAGENPDSAMRMT